MQYIHSFYRLRKWKRHLVLYVFTTFIPLLASDWHYIACSKLYLPYFGIKLFNLPCNRTAIKEKCSWKIVATASASSATFIIWQKIFNTLKIFIIESKCEILTLNVYIFWHITLYLIIVYLLRWYPNLQLRRIASLFFFIFALCSPNRYYK